jgi:hypothetical protein
LPIGQYRVHPASELREVEGDHVKLIMTISTVVNGNVVREGEGIEVGDWRLVDALLHNGRAVPADPEAARLWCDPAKNWILSWRRTK